MRAAANIAGEQFLIVGDAQGDHQLWIRAASDVPAAVALPLDDDFDLRLGAAQRLFRRMRGEPAGPLPSRLRVTPFQRLRLALLLNVFDHLLMGATKREIARDVVYPALESSTAAEWKASAERRRTQRLCDEAKAMVAAGYRRLLRGR